MSLFSRKSPPPMIQTVVKAPSSFITPAHNSGGFSAPPITQPTAPKISPQAAHTAQLQARRMPVPPQPPLFQPPELPPHFEKLPPAEKGRDGKFTRTKRSAGTPFELPSLWKPFWKSPRTLNCQPQQFGAERSYSGWELPAQRWEAGSTLAVSDATTFEFWLDC